MRTQLIIIALLTILSSTQIFCLPSDDRSIKDHYKKSDVIFEGEVIKVPEVPYINQTVRYSYTLRVGTVYKGEISGDVVINSNHENQGGYEFELGITYLVYAFVNDSLSTGIYTRTRPLDNAGPDIKFLKKLPESLKNSYVTGKVFFAESTASSQHNLPELGYVNVQLVEGEKKYSVLTDKNGTYIFESVETGIYFVKVITPKDLDILLFTDQDENNSNGNGVIEVEENRIYENTIICSYPSDIEGIVLDKDGSPLKNIMIEMVPKKYYDTKNEGYASFEDMYYPIIIPCLTNNFGSYHIKNLPPGEYYLGLNLLHSAYNNKPKTFFPGTDDVNKAIPVKISPYTNLREMNFKLKQYGYFYLTGEVKLLDGGYDVNVMVTLRSGKSNNKSDVLNSMETTDGFFYFYVIDYSEIWLHIDPVSNNVIEINGKKYKRPEPVRIIPKDDFQEFEITLIPSVE